MNQEEDAPVVVVLHGLESNPDGPLVIKMAEAFHDKGFTCCLVAPYFINFAPAAFVATFPPIVDAEVEENSIGK